MSTTNFGNVDGGISPARNLCDRTDVVRGSSGGKPTKGCARRRGMKPASIACGSEGSSARYAMR